MRLLVRGNHLFLGELSLENDEHGNIKSNMIVPLVGICPGVLLVISCHFFLGLFSVLASPPGLRRNDYLLLAHMQRLHHLMSPELRADLDELLRWAGCVGDRENRANLSVARTSN